MGVGQGLDKTGQELMAVKAGPWVIRAHYTMCSSSPVFKISHPPSPPHPQHDAQSGRVLEFIVLQHLPPKKHIANGIPSLML